MQPSLPIIPRTYQTSLGKSSVDGKSSVRNRSATASHCDGSVAKCLFAGHYERDRAVMGEKVLRLRFGIVM